MSTSGISIVNSEVLEEVLALLVALLGSFEDSDFTAKASVGLVEVSFIGSEEVGFCSEVELEAEVEVGKPLMLDDGRVLVEAWLGTKCFGIGWNNGGGRL